MITAVCALDVAMVTPRSRESFMEDGLRPADCGKFGAGEQRQSASYGSLRRGPGCPRPSSARFRPCSPKPPRPPSAATSGGRGLAALQSADVSHCSRRPRRPALSAIAVVETRPRDASDGGEHAGGEVSSSAVRCIDIITRAQSCPDLRATGIHLPCATSISRSTFARVSAPRPPTPSSA